jgi:hypothetical protein
MSSAPLIPFEEISRDATWLAQALDPASGQVRLIAMNRASYRAASFLDDRMLQQPVNAQVAPWPDVEGAVTGDLRSDARWIFHIGHVGSTLISRLLGELPSVLALREPRLLRDLALSPAEVRRQYVDAVPRLMSRTFAADELACVKATSFASEIAPELVPQSERALFLFARPDHYIPSILAGENSVKELHALAPTRVARMESRGVELPSPRNDAEFAACAWATEMCALEAAALAMTGRYIDWWDFDASLQDMPGALAEIAGFFSFDADQEEVAAIANGPLMRRYSKALEYDYSPTLRCDLIAEASRRHADDLRGALAMLVAAADKSPLLASALQRAGEG